MSLKNRSDPDGATRASGTAVEILVIIAAGAASFGFAYGVARAALSGILWLAQLDLVRPESAQ